MANFIIIMELQVFPRLKIERYRSSEFDAGQTVPREITGRGFQSGILIDI